MQLSIEGTHVFYRAIESIHFDAHTSELVLRTVSGKVYRKKVDSREVYEKFTKAILQRIAMCESV
jgi:hypothetical protein